jgi:hypothetical protein
MANKHTTRRPITAANNYGWVVESWEAQSAYDLACEYFGEEDINQQIVQAMSSDELAECLAFIFRMNDFREWDQYKEENADD